VFQTSGEGGEAYRRPIGSSRADPCGLIGRRPGPGSSFADANGEVKRRIRLLLLVCTFDRDRHDRREIGGEFDIALIEEDRAEPAVSVPLVDEL